MNGYDPRHVVLFCFPARLLNFINGLLTLFFSLTLFILRERFDLFFLGGGYIASSRMFLGISDFAGIWGGIFGAYAAYKNDSKWLSYFLYFQFYRFVNLIVCCIYDMPAITACELWLTNLHEMVNQVGFSPPLFKIAFEGRCEAERSAYISVTVLLLVLLFYLLFCGIMYRHQLQELPEGAKGGWVEDMREYIRGEGDNDYGSIRKSGAEFPPDNSHNHQQFEEYSQYLGMQQQQRPSVASQMMLPGGAALGIQGTVPPSVPQVGGPYQLQGASPPRRNAQGPVRG